MLIAVKKIRNGLCVDKAAGNYQINYPTFWQHTAKTFLKIHN